MKKKTLLAFLTFVALMGVSACTNDLFEDDDNKKSSSNSDTVSTNEPTENITGIWAHPNPEIEQTVWFRANGKIEFWENSQRIYQGSFTWDDTQIIITDTGTAPDGCLPAKDGVSYTYTHSPFNQLSLSSTTDTCAKRSEYLSHTWNWALTDWERIYPENSTFEFQTQNGQSRTFELEPQCSGADEDNQDFFFWVKPGSVDKWIVYLEGGMLCWNDINCVQIPTFVSSIDQDETEVYFYNEDGFMNPDKSQFADWGVLWVPYCTGDVHAGHQDTTYTDPDTQEPQIIHHRGLDNFLSALGHLQQNHQAPKDVLLAGSSAGGIGAFFTFPYVQEIFPDAKLSVFSDAGSGVIGDGIVALQGASWNFKETLPFWINGVNPEDLAGFTVAQYLQNLMSHYPNVRLGHFTTAYDTVQGRFFQQMLTPNDLGKWLNPDDSVYCLWNVRLQELQQSLRNFSSNYQSFIFPGGAHTVMNQRAWFDVKQNDVLLHEWMTAMVNGNTLTWNWNECEKCQGSLKFQCP